MRLLRLEDLDFERSVIRFRRAKGGKTLELALQPGTATAIRAYLERGRATFIPSSPTPSDDPGWLFLSHAGGEPRPLTMNSVSLMLTRRYHAGGGSLRCFGSHRIRHGTATLLVNNGMPLEEVSRYLGHSSTVPTRPGSWPADGELPPRGSTDECACGFLIQGLELARQQISPPVAPRLT